MLNELQKVFSTYSAEHIENKMIAQRISFVLRRNGVTTMEHLHELYFLFSDELKQMRGIGPYSINIIHEILEFHKERSEPDK